MRFVLLALALVAAVSGCFNVTPPAPGSASVLPDLSDVEPPIIDAARARMWWEDFVKNHPGRVSGTPTNIAAATQLERDLASAGYEARTFYYVPTHGIVPAAGPSPVPEGIRAVIGVKPGSTMPDHVIAWVAHYDSAETTVYAAYDDGSGTAVALELARALATYDNQKTLMPIFFDAEELGLVASENFVKQAMRDKTRTFDMVIGHDMTGINCPGHEWPMYQMVGENFADQLIPIETELYRDFLDLDVGHGEDAKNCIVILEQHDRNSDERRFKEAGIPILRMAGGRKAADYPAYHQPNDTIEYVYEFAGGAANYEAGLHRVVLTSWWNVVVFDRLPPLTG